MPDIRETGKIYCIEDAHTRTNSAYNEHDDDINIASVAVGRHSQGYQCYGFFKFAPHGIPENAVIVSAEFGGRVYNRLLAAEATLTARPCSGAWKDTEITYKTMPTSTGVSDQVSMGDQYSYFSADITSIAQAWLSGEFAYEDGLYVTSSAASSYKRVYSCTAADANKPYISLTYYVPASKPTADKTTMEIAAGSAVTITTNRLSDDYTHTLSWALGSRTGEIARSVAGAYTWALTASDVSALYAALPNAESGTLKIVCETFDAAGTSLGKESLSITASIPAGIRPSVTNISITGMDLGNGTYFLQGVSRMQVEVTAAPGEGAEIASVVVEVDGKRYNGNSITTDVLKDSGRVSASTTVTDTRGRTANFGYGSTIPVYAYSAPTLNAFVIERCTEDGAAVKIDGEKLRFTLDAKSSLVAMPSVNPVKAEIYTKLRSAAEWTLSVSYSDERNTLSLENVLLPGTFSPLSSYDVQLLLTDGFGTQTERRTVITTATSLLHFDPAHTRVTLGRIGETTDPESALITALDLIAEAGVSLHGADVADGQIDLPDGGMIAASAGFELAQDNAGAIRTLESVTVTAESESGTQMISCDLGGSACEAEVDFAAGTCRQEWGYLELDGTENWQGCKAPSGNWMAWLRPDPPAAYTPAAEIGNIICSGLTPVPANELPNATSGGIATVYNEPIVFLEQPVNTCSVPVGAIMAFSAFAQGNGLTYQWQYKQSASGGWMNSTASSATTPYFYYTAANYHNGYQYRCVVTDADGNIAISDIGTVTITTAAAPAILITGDPADQTGRLGSMVTFAVAARGEGLTYQWQWQSADGKTGGNSGLSTANTAALNVPATADRNGQRYRCVVTDSSGNTATTEYATFIVGEKAGSHADIMLSIPGVAYETYFAEYLANQHAAGTPVTVAYKLAQPIENRFAPQVIAAPGGSYSLSTNADSLTGFVAGGRIFYTIARAINALGEA